MSKTAITYSQSRLVNLGNYENLTITVGVTIDDLAEDQLEDTYAKAIEFVHGKLAEQTKEAQKGSLNAVTKNAAKKVEAKKVKKEKVKEEPIEETAVEEDTVEEVEEKPVVKKAKKPAKVKSKSAEEEQESQSEDTVLTADDVRKALMTYAKANSKEAAKALLKDVGGVTKISEVDVNDYADIIIAAEE